MGCYDRGERELDPRLQTIAEVVSEKVYPAIPYVDGFTGYDRDGREAVLKHAPGILALLIDKGIVQLEQLEALK